MSCLQTKMSQPAHQVEYRVIYGDTDAAGIVYHANYLRYFEIGRTELMRKRGMPYSRIEELGFILPVTECYTRFKASARYDELITIHACMAEVKRVSCRFHYRITRPVEGREQLLVKGFTVHACVDANGKLAPFSPEVLESMHSVCDAAG